MPKVSEEHLEARRRQILDAALTCFSREGFHRTPMQAIFEESGLSPGAVYRYFKGKEEIVQAIALETLGSFAAAIESGPPGGPDVVLGRLLDAIDSISLRDHRLRLALQIWGEAIVNPGVGGFVREAIEGLRRRMAAELLASDPDGTARVLVALVQGMVIQPDVFVHQLTALSASIDMRHIARDFAETNRLRTEGTDHLLAAGRAVGVERFVAQSYAGWPFARTGGPVKDESDPLDPTPPEGLREMLDAIRHLEEAVTGAAWTEGVVLRYGGFYGPGTSLSTAPEGEHVALIRQRKFPVVGNGAGVWSFIHIEDAATATVAAVEH